MNTTTDTSNIAEPRSSRRNLLRLAGAAAVGGAAAALATGTSADAASVAWMTEAVTITAATTTMASSAARSLSVSSSFSTGGEAVYGEATKNGTGVHGYINATATDDGFGVWGEIGATKGFALVASGGSSQLLLARNNSTGLPQTTAGRAGAIHANSEGLFYCTVGDKANGDTWTTLADSASSGSFHAIGPWRVYDSRKAAPGPQSPLSTGSMRTVSVKDARDVNTGAVTVADVVWAGAKAIAYNVTVVNTVGSNGFLAINMGDNTTVTASAINWSASNLTLANASVVRVNNNRQINVICGGTATSCHFIIDVVGFYR